MLGKIAAFEFRYQLRQPAFWVITLLFALISFGLVALSENVKLTAGANVHVNSPYAISLLQAGLNQFYMLAAAAIVANVVVRDYSTGFGALIFSTPITRADYLFGRFIGAFGVLVLTLVLAQCGHLFATTLPYIDAETLGPRRLQDYAWSFLVIGLPGLFFISALFFALATLTRSMMATYVGVVAVFILYLVANTLLAQKPELETLNAWIEPFGAGAYGLVTKYWTAAEQNAKNPPVEGILLWTRLLWTGVSLGFLGLAWALFSRSARGAKATRKDRQRGQEAAAVETRVRAAPLPAPSFGFRSAWTQLVSLTAFEMSLVFKSIAYVVLILLALAFSVLVLALSGEIYGAPVMLTTRVVITGLQGAFALIAIIIAIYYSGELVWRDRDRRMHELVDATPTPDWTFIVPKTIALTLVLASTLLIGVLAGVAMQLIKGVADIEIGKYIWWYVVPDSINYAQLAILAIVVQALSPNKFVGWALMAVYIISNIFMAQLGLDHVLYRYGSGVGTPLSDMNGTGDFGVFAAWMNLYWSAFGLVLLVLAYGLWRRGTETRLAPRLKRLPGRLAGPAGLIGGAALAAFVGLGVFVYINTNVWNAYRSRDAAEARLAAMEKTLLQYETLPQPSVADVKLTLDLHPHTPRLTTTGVYTIVNRTDAPLTQIHLRWNDDLEMRRLEVEGAVVARDWPEFDYRIYRFETPMQPGERRTVRFETVLTQRGFRNSGNTVRLVDNGTFVNNMEFAPIVGMDRDGLLQDRSKRRKRGLPAELRMASLDDERAARRNYIGADWVNADITVVTDADQTPIAPGYKVSDTTRDGRRTARFVTESPVLDFFSVQSARYEETRRTHDGVEMVVFHDPRHDANVPRMLDALAASLDYYQTAFGPYQFRQARIVEFPDYASFAQSYPNTFAWSEGLGFIADLGDPSKIDYVSYVGAHEFAHQWWAHQIVGADVQGATLLSETLAQYSALMVMERLHGEDQIRKFLKYELDRYLVGRRTAQLDESPLFRVESGQTYIHYQKGGLVLYLLRDQIGEEAVNRALRRLLSQYAFQSAPWPRSVDLIAALRAEAPADKQDLITDLFERITLYDLKAESATATRRADGRWDVTLTVQTRKLYADGKGEETEAPLNETFDIGLFSVRPGDRAFGRDDVILLERRPVAGGRQVIRLIAPNRPAFVGIDPYNKWIDRDSNDNIVAVAG